MGKVKTVLIVGGSGFVGTRLALKFRDEYKVFATYKTKKISIPGVTALPMDLENENWVKRVVYTCRPNIVIYAAGNNDPELAEANPTVADLQHVGGVTNVANAMETLQPRFIYISSSYVFDGHRGNYRETDGALASSLLGKIIMAGENFVRSRYFNHLIIRSSPLLGRGNGRNFSLFDKMRILLDRGQRIELPNHELHSFANIGGLTDLTKRIIDSGSKIKTIHYGGLTKLTHMQMGKMFAEKFGFNPALVVEKKRPESEDDDGSIRDYSLNTTQMASAFNIPPLETEGSLELIKQILVPSL